MTTDERYEAVTAALKVKQADIAARLPMDETLLSRILNGRRPEPEGFRERFVAIVDELTARETAGAA
jgi:transcriptional regulator with XRE-family HTH domain